MKNGSTMIILSKKSWIGPSQLLTSTKKRIHGNKILLCI